MKKAFLEFYHRPLSDRQKARLGKSAITASVKIVKRSASEDPLRTDDFFEEDDTGRSPAEEVLEEALRQCIDEHEEKKSPFLVNIFVNAVFEEISRESVIEILKIAGRMTYQQMCLLHMVEKANELDFDTQVLNVPNIAKASKVIIEHSFLYHDLTALGSPGIAVIDYDTSNRVTRSSERVEATRIGKICHKLADLDEIPVGDVDRIKELTTRTSAS